MTASATQRLGLTLDLDEYARVVAYAREAGRPMATVAKRLLLQAIDGHDPDAAAAALSRERDRVRQLEAEVTRLQAQLTERQTVAELATQLPRWRWPLETLLADDPWWDEWLPLLGELIGRRLEYDRGYDDRQAETAVVDDRGFADLMRYLFPDLRDDSGEVVPWRSSAYPRHVRLTWESTGPRSALRQRPVRAEVWEPVIRHVARALTALETTSQAPGDAYTHLRVEAEIRGEWMRTLGALLGEEGGQRPDHLPRDPLP
jgi:hypothetical protein